ncbi:hypothetical protein PT974_03591 [Cladobotryum mycophilum]|uniref:Uncharacterized protein n=1 Tax=Cladobotryum mycophilum TaxID=491253 RepID=A0ABR0SSV9_9HYPO
MSALTIDLQSLASADGDHSIETKLLNILDFALNSPSQSETSVETVASQIDQLFSGPDDAEEVIWATWTFILNVVKKIPIDDERLQFLVSVVGKLKTKSRQTVEIWGSNTNVWKDLPLFGAVAREAWNGIPEFNGTEQDTLRIAEWISLNSFAARIVGESIQPWTNFGLWELRDGLEQPLSSAIAKETYLTTTSEWLTHAGKVLHEEGKKVVQLDEHDLRALASGKLFKGKPGFSDERWNFWRQRLEELSAEAGHGEVVTRTEKAIEVMNGIQG